MNSTTRLLLTACVAAMLGACFSQTVTARSFVARARVLPANPLAEPATCRVWSCDATTGEQCARLCGAARHDEKTRLEPGLHHLGLTVERLVVPLPSLAEGTQILVGVELQLGDGEPLRTVAGLAAVRADHTVELTELARVRPFLYRGNGLGLRLVLYRAKDEEVAAIRGRLLGQPPTIRELDLRAPRALADAASLFSTVMSGAGPFTSQYLGDLRFQLGAADRSPGLPLRAGRVAILASDATPAPPLELVSRLALRGTQLDLDGPMHAHDRYVHSTYVVLTVERRYRTACREQRLDLLNRWTEALVEAGNHDEAEPSLGELDAAITADTTCLGRADRAVLRGLVALRRARLTLGRLEDAAALGAPEAPARLAPARAAVLAVFQQLLTEHREVLLASELRHLTWLHERERLRGAAHAASVSK